MKTKTIWAIVIVVLIIAIIIYLYDKKYANKMRAGGSVHAPGSSREVIGYLCSDGKHLYGHCPWYRTNEWCCNNVE